MNSILPSYVVVTPVRDEIAYIEKTIESMLQQTCQPERWVIVDDGSTDGTSALLDRYATSRPWILVVHRANRGFRAAGNGVMDAFYEGFARVEKMDWDYIVKLDADLSFDSTYFARCFAHFDAEPDLGIGGGTVCSLEHDIALVEAASDPPFHVRGATKIYRRSCWQRITPLIVAPGWDTLDEVKANLLGWRTRTFAEIELIQHKPTGSADGRWKDAFKNGRANYLTGYHPAFMLAKCVRRLSSRPFGVESAGLLSGFLSGYLKRMKPLADGEVIRYLRGQQMRRLLLRPSIYG